MPYEMFYPQEETRGYIKENLPCQFCPVKQDCLDYAIVYDEFGIWGGLTRKDRNGL